MANEKINSKFSDQLIEAMKANAPLNWEKAQELGLLFDEKPKAIVASAIRLNIPYVRIERKVAGDKPVTKEQLVADIAQVVGVDAEDLDGLDKATKLALQKLAQALSS